MHLTGGWFTRVLTGDRQPATPASATGASDDAIAAFVKAGHYLEGARYAERHGQRGRAVELYIKAVLGADADVTSSRSSRQAGELLAAAGDYTDAIALFEEAGAWKLAADMALKVNLSARAARLYERAEAWGPAAAAFERLGETADALRMLDNEIAGLHAEHSPDHSRQQRLRDLLARRAELLAKLGRRLEAALAYRNLGLPGRAAPLYLEAGHPKEASELYLAAGEPEEALRCLDRVAGGHASEVEPRQAAAIYRQLGRHREAAAAFVRAGANRQAAEQFQAAGDWLQAAAQWELCQEPLLAAHAFRHASRLIDAARCFDAAGNPLQAAEAWAEAGESVRAAEAYDRAGAPYRAARQYLRAGRRTDAVGALQRVNTAAPEFAPASFELVPLLLELGLHEPALHRLAMLPDDGKTLVDRLYWQARAHEAAGHLPEARLAYQKLLALDRQHRDVSQRLAALPTAEVTGLTALQVANTGPPAPRLDALPIGYRLRGRYEILAELGHGGMGKVYKALDHDLAEVVAIKTLLRSTSSTEAERLLREVQICRRITHPNVVRIYDIGREADGLFVTMEFADGPTLEALTERRPGPSLSLARIKWILAETAAGLAAAHELHVVHRDLKPGNLILTDTRLKIVDFGIAQVAGTSNRLTQAGYAVGTPMYMSPEQIRGADLDGRSDLYSLGIIAYRLLAGHEPFVGDSAATMMLMHLQQAPAPLAAFRAHLPVAWQALVDRLLAKNPADRIGSAELLLRLLDDLPDERTAPPAT
jgi:serine/threonine-protein kinase